MRKRENNNPVFEQRAKKQIFNKYLKGKAPYGITSGKALYFFFAEIQGFSYATKRNIHYICKKAYK
jgi:hypothetical protein